VKDRLSRFQREILEGFFERQEGFFLTGGGALAGYHLGHRSTQDLDLFTRSDLMDEGDRTLLELAAGIGAEVEPLTTSPAFRRRLVRRGDATVIVDLVLDRTPRGAEEPRLHGKVAVDPPAEILANKLCTLLSRAELRDMVDVMALEAAGHDLEGALALAARKDSGLSPAQLAWVLSQVRIGPDAEIPGGYSAAEVQDYLEALQERLTRMAHPRGSR